MDKSMKKADFEIFLKQYNLWYHGMTVREMRQCCQALENSLSDSCSSERSTINSSNENAGQLSASSDEDISCRCDMNYNNFNNFRYSSESIDIPSSNLLESSPIGSPETVRHYVVHADVHHPMDWSPKKDATKSKMKGSKRKSNFS